MTKLICPVCQSMFLLEQAAHEALMWEVVDLAGKFGRNWELVHEYIDTFRQEQFGSVMLKKKVRLLKEIWRLFDTNSFEYQGKRYRTDWARILAGMTVVVNVDKFGFRNHNYLKKVMVAGAERLSVEGLTAREEEKREGKRRSGEAGKRGPSYAKASEGREESETMTGPEYKKKKGIESLADSIGKRMDDG